MKKKIIAIITVSIILGSILVYACMEAARLRNEIDRSKQESYEKGLAAGWDAALIALLSEMNGSGYARVYLPGNKSIIVVPVMP